MVRNDCLILNSLVIFTNGNLFCLDILISRKNTNSRTVLKMIEELEAMKPEELDKPSQDQYRDNWRINREGWFLFFVSDIFLYKDYELSMNAVIL